MGPAFSAGDITRAAGCEHEHDGALALTGRIMTGNGVPAMLAAGAFR